MLLLVPLLMSVVPGALYALHVLLVLVTKRGTYRLFFWPDYAAIPLAFAVWCAIELACGFVSVAAGKSLVNFLLEPLGASLPWSALLLARSLANLVFRREPTRRDAFLSSAVLLAVTVLAFVFTPCLPE